MIWAAENMKRKVKKMDGSMQWCIGETGAEYPRNHSVAEFGIEDIKEV